MLWSSPRAWDGLLFVGVSSQVDLVAERGREVALDQATGRVRWSTPLVTYQGGGASVWPTAAVLPSLGLVYIATGNPNPEQPAAQK